jgi:hypothetical protein
MTSEAPGGSTWVEHVVTYLDFINASCDSTSRPARFETTIERRKQSSGNILGCLSTAAPACGAAGDLHGPGCASSSMGPSGSLRVE